MSRPIPLSDEALELVAARFRALGEASRLKLLRVLSEGERSVGELVGASGLSQANASRHLNALHQAGLLGRRKEGVSVYYKMADPGLLELCHWVCGGIRRQLADRQRELARGGTGPRNSAKSPAPRRT